MARVTPAAITEWLKRRGVFQMPTRKNRRTIRRWLRDHLMATAGVVFVLGAAVGWLLGKAPTW